MADPKEVSLEMIIQEYQNRLHKLQQENNQLLQLKQRIEEWEKSTRERADTKYRDDGNKEREKRHHNCFQDGKMSGYLWCLEELQQLLKEDEK